MTDEPRYPVGSAGSALRVVSMLAEAGALRVSQVAAELEIGKSTAHRLLAMLKLHGYAVQDDSRTYRPGPALEQMSHQISQHAELRALMRPFMERLTSSVGAATHLMILVGNGTRFIESVEAQNGASLGSRTGMLLPAHATAGGKAMLADLSYEQLWALYPRGVPGGGTVPARSLQSLIQDLRVIRRRGYATNRKESAPGIAAVGICVPTRRSRAKVGLAVAFRSQDVDDDAWETAAEELLNEATRMKSL